MDALSLINPNVGFQMNLSSVCISAPMADTRCQGLSPLGGGFPAASQPQAMDPLMQTQLMMNQTLMGLMQMMLNLMLNRGGGASGDSNAAGPAPLGGGSSATGSSSSSSGGASAGMPQASDTGKKLAEAARKEATNGDSSGGWCYRDVGRALRTVGINTSGASAYMAADQLAKNPKVKEVKVSKEDLTRLPPGAIVVWDKGAGHEHGHISISTGDGKEASDLMRNQITNYGTSFRVFMPV